MSLTILLNADDFGLTEGISRSILEAHDEGMLTGVSVLANGHFFDEAVAEARRRPDLRLSVHLNLVEGMALSHPGPLRHSFLSLWRAKTVPDKVRTELAAQVRRVADAIGRAPDGLNGHRHAHMIPGVFECVLDLAEELSIPYVRLPEDRGPWRPGPGWIKRLVLNRLARRNRPLLQGRKVSTCDAFLGVLHTGRMTTEAVRVGLRGIESGSTVEILFHPGGAVPGDEELLRYRRFYFDPARRRELEELKSGALKGLLESVAEKRLDMV